MDGIFPESENENIETPVEETDAKAVEDFAEEPLKETADDTAEVPEDAEKVSPSAEEEDVSSEPDGESAPAEEDVPEDVSAGEEDAPYAEEEIPRDRRERSVPRGKRRRRRPAKEKKKHVGLIIAAVIITIVLIAAVSVNFIITPKYVTEKFYEAMKTHDLELLSYVAEPRGSDEDFTVMNTRPFFAMYDSDDEFRRSVEQCLTEDSVFISAGKAPGTDGVVDLRVINFYLFKLYRVSVATSDVVIYTNFNGAKVALGDITKVAYSAAGYNYNAHGLAVTDDYFDYVRSKAVFNGMLPGNYAVNVEYLSSFGEMFTAEGLLPFTTEDNEFELNLEFEQIEFVNSTEFDIGVTVGDKGENTVAAGETYRIFPLKAGEEVTFNCDTGDELSVTKTLVAGEDKTFELSFDAVDIISNNNIPIDFYINGEKRGTVPASAGEYRIYPVNTGDEVEFKPQNESFAKLLLPLKVTAGESEETVTLQFAFKSSVYAGVDEIVTQDVLTSFEIINAAYTMEELKDKLLEYRTLAELIEYADYETSGMYSTISEPQITIDLDNCADAHLVDDVSPRISVDAHIAFKVGYHEKDKEPEELVDKEALVTYTLAYVNGAWEFEPAESLVI